MSEERRSDDEERQRQGARKNGLCRDVGELLLVQQQQERTKKADAGSRELLLLNVLVERRQPRIPLNLSPLPTPHCHRISHLTKKGMCGRFSMFWSPSTPACAGEGGQLSAAAAV